MTDRKCFCGAEMRLVTQGRGYRTYSCSHGCDYHLHEVDEKYAEYMRKEKEGLVCANA